MFFSTFAVQHHEIVQIILTLDPSIGGGRGGGGPQDGHGGSEGARDSDITCASYR